MRSHRVVVPPPLFDDDGGFLQAVEDFSVEQLIVSCMSAIARTTDSTRTSPHVRKVPTAVIRADPPREMNPLSSPTSRDPAYGKVHAHPIVLRLVSAPTFF